MRAGTPALPGAACAGETPTPYVRERAALLRIASGVPPAVTARERLLRPRHPETVYLWLNRWEAEGIDSLPIRDGRGRTPAFSP